MTGIEPEHRENRGEGRIYLFGDFRRANLSAINKKEKAGEVKTTDGGLGSNEKIRSGA